tara:strand:- start:1729 stop:2193 length:465 start_codon:yes stop_codon:yes gene_type:complete
MQREVYPAPDPNVLFYQRKLDNGRTEFASMQSLQKYEGTSWRGRFFIPGQAAIVLDQYSTELKHWEPVYALTQQDIEMLIERVAQRVTDLLGNRDVSAPEIVAASMEVANSKDVPAAIRVATKKTKPKERLTCKVCNRKFKTVQGRKVHEARSH